MENSLGFALLSRFSWNGFCVCGCVICVFAAITIDITKKNTFQIQYSREAFEYEYSTLLEELHSTNNS